MPRPTLSSCLCALALPLLAAAKPLPAELASAALSALTKGHSPNHGHGHQPELIYDGYPRAATAIGYVSIALWICVSFDQIWTCYVQKSGEGLSLVFLAIWLAGDLTNLLGSFWQELLPTVILLAVYYTLCDITLIFQVFYYRYMRSAHPDRYATPAPSSLAPPTEADPLLSSFSSHGPNQPALSKRQRITRDAISYGGAVLFAVTVGIVAWRGSVGVNPGRKLEVWNTKAQVVGWISAALYLGSRLPQIKKNTEASEKLLGSQGLVRGMKADWCHLGLGQTKCQGLSLLMFAFAMLGNLTYVASILFQSVSPQHLLVNASWLVGSGGTIFLDAIVLGQFVYYSKARKAEGKIFLDDGAADAAGEDTA